MKLGAQYLLDVDEVWQRIINHIGRFNDEDENIKELENWFKNNAVIIILSFWIEINRIFS